jgi:hypothetical protein
MLYSKRPVNGCFIFLKRGDKVMEFATTGQLHEIHKAAVNEQGRKLSWIASQLGCSYSLIHKYLNGHKVMSQTKVEQLHRILFK